MSSSFRLWLWSLLTGSRIKALLMEGKRLLDGGHQTDALEVYRAVTQQWSQNPQGYLGMGRAYEAMGLRLEANREKTIGQSLSILAETPDDSKTRMKLAEALLEKDMFGWAAAHMESVLKISHRDLEAQRLAARAFRLNGNFDKAVNAISILLKKEPLEAGLYEQLAFNLRATQRNQEAVKALALAKALKAVSDDPGDSTVVDQAVRQFQAGGQKRLCLALVERSLQGNPNQSGLHRLRGELLLEAHLSQEALLALRKAVDLDPTNIKAQRLLARAYLLEGHRDKARHHMTLAQEMETAQKSQDPLSAEVVIIRVLLDSGRQDQAGERAAMLARDHKDNWRAPFVLGMVLKRQKKMKAALESFMQARRLNQRAHEPHMEIAWILSDAGQVLEAIGEGRQAVKLAPRDPKVRRSLSKMLRTHGFMDQAIEEEDLAESLASRE